MFCAWAVYGWAGSLKMHLTHPDAYDGAVLIAPMCKIADDMVPHWLVKHLLIGIANFLPKQKLIPMKDLADKAFKEEERLVRNCLTLSVHVQNITYTGVELPRVSLPLLILHGEADAVTDLCVRKALYEKAISLDKKRILYERAYHSILEGESDESIFRVLDDTISWLDQHCREKLQK